MRSVFHLIVAVLFCAQNNLAAVELLSVLVIFADGDLVPSLRRGNILSGGLLDPAHLCVDLGRNDVVDIGGVNERVEESERDVSVIILPAPFVDILDLPPVDKRYLLKDLREVPYEHALYLAVDISDICCRPIRLEQILTLSKDRRRILTEIREERLHKQRHSDLSDIRAVLFVGIDERIQKIFCAGQRRHFKHRREEIRCGIQHRVKERLIFSPPG